MIETTRSSFALPEKDHEGRSFDVRDRQILGELRFGRARAETEEDFARRISMRKVDFRKRMERMRRSGVPICSAVEEPAGVFLPATRAEGMECYRSLRRRYTTQAMNARAMLPQIMALDQPPDATPVMPHATLWDPL